ncbi:MAG: hypothetical protein H6739_13855 [Alphaproteobacteria bacterium]|nr:hypothetical protein [Alphaproteobacteria bacterium]
MGRHHLRLSALVTLLPLVGCGDGDKHLQVDSGALPLDWSTPAPRTQAPIGPVLAPSTTTLDFGVVQEGCQSERTLVLHSTGDAAVTITGLSLSRSSVFAPAEPPPLPPITLEPSDALALPLTFTPRAGHDPFEATLTVSSDGGDHEIALRGALGMPKPRVERWQQTTPAPVDLFFVADTSASMDHELEDMSGAFMPLYDGLIAQGSRLGVATGDSGCTDLDPFIPSDQPATWDLARFDHALEATQQTGLYAEGILTILRNALLPDRLRGCNAELFLDGRRAHFVLIADEPEQSPQPAGSWATTLAVLQASWPDIEISAIVARPPDGCDAAEPGPEYVAVAEATGGLVLDICDARWEDHYDALLERAADRTPTRAFTLSEVPDPASLEVSVNGVSVPVGWRWSPDTNAVVFDQPPVVGAQIEVRYWNGAPCD